MKLVFRNMVLTLFQKGKGGQRVKIAASSSFWEKNFMHANCFFSELIIFTFFAYLDIEGQKTMILQFL